MVDKNPDGDFSDLDTLLVTAGRDPHANFGFVNPPVYHGSTVLFPTAEKLIKRDQIYLYGRRGTPTSDALEKALSKIHGGFGSKVVSSGLGAITTAFLSYLKSSDHILVSDSVYRPTRMFCDNMLAKFGVETTYYDPVIGDGIEALVRPDTRLIYTECPGSQSMEIQDIPAIVAVARKHGCLVATDNTWSTPVYFDAFGHGIDIVVQAGTKYVVGHSDVMIGSVTVTEALWPQLHAGFDLLGQCVGPDDIYLALRGLRTMGVRLAQHMRSGIAIAEWLDRRPEVDLVLHPALPSSPGHDIWKRDFSGASGLFSVVLKPVSEAALHAFLNHLELFGMGYSWGGYESLVVPFKPDAYRSATKWPHAGPALRFHVGLENVDDLKRDLAAGFERMAAAA
jgi:cystathionine beta-lyase